MACQGQEALSALDRHRIDPQLGHDLGRRCPGEHVLKEIFPGLRPYFVNGGKIKRNIHDVSPKEISLSPGVI